jgi:hypothetical protein
MARKRFPKSELPPLTERPVPDLSPHRAVVEAWRQLGKENRILLLRDLVDDLKPEELGVILDSMPDSEAHAFVALSHRKILYYLIPQIAELEGKAVGKAVERALKEHRGGAQKDPAVKERRGIVATMTADGKKTHEIVKALRTKGIVASATVVRQDRKRL